MADDPYVLVPLRDRSGAVIGHTKVDPCRADWVNQWRWHRNDAGYAVRHTTRSRKGQRTYGTYRLHRELVGLAKGDRREVDHWNRDRLDNRLSNLRIVEHAQQGQNIMRVGGTSPYRGVSWDKGTAKWRAIVTLNGRAHHLGVFTDEGEAARVAAAFRREHMPFSQDAVMDHADPEREADRVLDGPREIELPPGNERPSIEHDRGHAAVVADT